MTFQAHSFASYRGDLRINFWNDLQCIVDNVTTLLIVA